LITAAGGDKKYEDLACLDMILCSTRRLLWNFGSRVFCHRIIERRTYRKLYTASPCDRGLWRDPGVRDYGLSDDFLLNPGDYRVRVHDPVQDVDRQQHLLGWNSYP